MIRYPTRNAILAALCTVILPFAASCGNSPADSDAPTPSSISLSSTLLYLKLDESAVVTVEVLDQHGSLISDPVLAWSSSNDAVASAGGRGLITAHSFGTATITVRSGLKTAVIHVFVSDELDALVAFYTAMSGPFWKNNSNWLSTRPLGEWYGIELNSNGRVEELALEGNGLRGELPAELGGLKQLIRLNLSNNDILGDIPPELGRLSGLRELILSGNAISGRLPGSLGDLRNLELLYLIDNRLSGEIPASLGRLSRLWYMDLDGNALSGEIPSSLGDLSRLTLLSIADNKLGGEIPASLGGLTRLKNLDLGGNGLTGNLPPELAGMSSLTQLHLDHNGLSGEIPPEFGTFAALERMFLSDNLLSGPVPPGLGRLNTLWQLDLRNNRQLAGPLPLELANLTNLRALWLTGTGLCAPADPDFLAWLEVVGKDSGLEGVVVCE